MSSRMSLGSSSMPSAVPVSWKPSSSAFRSSLGASAPPSPSTVTSMEPETTAGSPPSRSVVVAVTVSAKLPGEKPSAEVMVRF